MPWKEVRLMSVREEFVLRALQPGSNKSALCREFGVSRKTGHKWLERYASLGLAGLEDMSRRPGSTPLKVSGDVVAEVVAIRRRHPRYGAKKILEILRETLKRPELPTVRTIARILVRTGFVQPAVQRPRTPSNSPAGAPKVSVLKPNDLWTVDFKGWWLAINRKRCEPLTVRDAFSRFVLRIEVLPSTAGAAVRRIFEQLFTLYGLPKAIQSDNGVPFAIGHGKLGLTTLSAWWLSLGIEHVRSRPGKPSDNGAHERMHRDMAEDLQSCAALTPKAQQDACERWRNEFNNYRPHEALAMKRPAQVYRRSAVHFDSSKAIDIEYPARFRVYKVNAVGMISMRKRNVFISHALRGQHVGLAYEGHNQYVVWFAAKKLGVLDCSPDYLRFAAAA
jgi:putative transposase